MLKILKSFLVASLLLVACKTEEVVQPQSLDGITTFSAYVDLTYANPSKKEVEIIVYSDDVPESLKYWYFSHETKISESAARIYLKNDNPVSK